MLTPDQKVRALFEEKRERRSEMIVYIQAQQNTILALIVFFASTAGLYANPELVKDAWLSKVVLSALTQVIYFLLIYILSQFSLLAANGGYVAAIEAQINRIAGDTLTLYESRYSGDNAQPNILRDPLALSVCMMGIILLSSWAFCVFVVLTRFPSKALAALVVIAESVLLGLLVAKSLATKGDVTMTMRKAFSPEEADKKPNQISDTTSEPAPGAASSAHQG